MKYLPLALVWLGLLAVTSPGHTVAQSADSISTGEVDGHEHRSEDDIDDISLESLLDVTVSAAAKYEQSARDAASSVSVISAEEIKHYGYRTVREALESVRGFYISDDREYAYVGVRGFGRAGDFNTRVLLMLDGHPLNEVSSGFTRLDHYIGVDMRSVERIEVVWGPGSALYGSGAMLAVVNVVTRDASASDRLVASAEVGSRGYRGGTASVAKAFGQRASVQASGFWGQEQGVDRAALDYTGSRLDNPLTQRRAERDYYGLLSTVRLGDFTVRGRLARKHHDTPTYGILFDGSVSDMLTTGGTVGVAYERDVATGMHLLAQAHADRAVVAAQTPLVMPGMPLTAVIDFEAASHWVTSEVQFRWDTGPANRLTMGLEHRYARAASDVVSRTALAEQAPTPLDWHYEMQKDRRIISGYVQDEYHLSRSLSATLGLRYDHYEANSAVSPRLGFVFTPTTTSTVKLLYGSAFRAAGIFELYNEDFRLNLVPNPNLKPERIHTAELVWDQGLTSHVFSTVALYRYRMDGLIDMVYDAERGVQQNLNAGEVDSYGVELGLQARFPSRLHGYANYTYTYTQDRQREERLSNSPAHLAKVGLTGLLPGHTSLATQVRYESARRSGLDEHTDDYVLMDVTLRKGRLLEHFDVALTLRNVLDASYRHPGSYRYGHYLLDQEGRQVVLTLGFRLD